MDSRKEPLLDAAEGQATDLETQRESSVSSDSGVSTQRPSPPQASAAAPIDGKKLAAEVASLFLVCAMGSAVLETDITAWAGVVKDATDEVARRVELRGQDEAVAAALQDRLEQDQATLAATFASDSLSGMSSEALHAYGERMGRMQQRLLKVKVASETVVRLHIVEPPQSPTLSSWLRMGSSDATETTKKSFFGMELLEMEKRHEAAAERRRKLLSEPVLERRPAVPARIPVVESPAAPDDRLAVLQQQYEALGAHIDELRDQRAPLRAELAEWQAKLKAAFGELDDLDREASEAEKQITSTLAHTAVIRLKLGAIGVLDEDEYEQVLLPARIKANRLNAKHHEELSNAVAASLRAVATEEARRELRSGDQAGGEQVDSDATLCVICEEAPPGLRLQPCGHANVCAACGSRLKRCVTCRGQVSAKVPL